MTHEQIKYANRYANALRDKLRYRLLNSDTFEPITPDQVKWFVSNAILDALHGMKEFDENNYTLLDKERMKGEWHGIARSNRTR